MCHQKECSRKIVFPIILFVLLMIGEVVADSGGTIPIAESQTITVTEDTPLKFLLKANDKEGASLGFRLISQPQHGQVSINSRTGVAHYFPDENYFTSSDVAEGFTFVVNDGELDSAVATVRIMVDAVNDAPSAENINESTQEGRSLELVLKGNDVDADSLTYVLPSRVTQRGGVVTFKSAVTGIVKYVPADGFFGVDSFVYQVKDDQGALSQVATVVIDVTRVNQAPLAKNIKVSVKEEGRKKFKLKGSDADKDVVTFRVIDQPNNGSLTLNAKSGQVVYRPDANYSSPTGKPDRFTYRVNDGSLDSSLATVKINVKPKNDRPTVDDISASTDEDTPINIDLIARDIDGDDLTYILVSTTSDADGKLVLTGNNTVNYQPKRDYFGEDSFTFKVNDGQLDSKVGTVTVVVHPVNDAPQVQAINAKTKINKAVGISPMGSDPEGDTLIYLANVSSEQGGSITGQSTYTDPQTGKIFAVTNGAAFVFTPKSGFEGSDRFTYKAADRDLDKSPAFSEVAEVTVAVTGGLTGKLNDTGVISCINGGDSLQPCPQLAYPGQDGDFGRDVSLETNDNADGYKGFSFTKLDSTGQPLAIQGNKWDENGSEANGTQWSCVKDKVTGLVWEVKRDDGDLQDKDRVYYYNFPQMNNCVGPIEGQNATACDLPAYTKAINKLGLCGLSNWRVPAIGELQSIAHLALREPAIDKRFFPYALVWYGSQTVYDRYYYWSSTPYPEAVAGTSRIWTLNSHNGDIYFHNAGGVFPVRLVSGE